MRRTTKLRLMLYNVAELIVSEMFSGFHAVYLSRKTFSPTQSFVDSSFLLKSIDLSTYMKFFIIIVKVFSKSVIIFNTTIDQCICIKYSTNIHTFIWSIQKLLYCISLLVNYIFMQLEVELMSCSKIFSLKIEVGNKMGFISWFYFYFTSF